MGYDMLLRTANIGLGPLLLTALFDRLEESASSFLAAASIRGGKGVHFAVPADRDEDMDPVPQGQRGRSDASSSSRTPVQRGKGKGPTPMPYDE